MNKLIEIKRQIPPSIYVFTDITVLKTIFRNLISNAIKFTPTGGEINISIEQYSSKLIEINVKDSGIGMEKEIIDNLFYPEISTNRIGTNGEESIGLGLIITKELIVKQGGNIVIESAVDKGSTFRFTVPKS